MKIYLDDVREAPSGWIHTTTPYDTIELLKLGLTTHMSLDHDLGDDVNIGTGYDVLLWIEQEVQDNPKFKVPDINVHSMNPVGVVRMLACINSIKCKKYVYEKD